MLDFVLQFDFAVMHMLGKSNVVADALSCRPDLATAVVDTWRRVLLCCSECELLRQLCGKVRGQL